MLRRHILVMNKVVIFIIVIAVTLCSNVLTSNADTSIGYISIEKFECMMNELYSKYDSSFKVVDDNEIEYISIVYAEEMYQRAKVAFEQSESDEMRNVSGEFYNYNNPIINPQAMPVDYYASDKFTVSAKSFVGYSSYMFYLSGTVNAQNDTFMSVTYSGLRQTGTAVCYDGYDIVNERTWYSSGGSSYTISIIMDVYFSWTEPNTNLRFSETINYHYANTYDAVDGII